MTTYRAAWVVGLSVLTLLCRPALAAEFALVPVQVSTGQIVGPEAVMPTGGGRVTLDIFVSAWDVDRNGDPLLQGYQAQIDSTGFTSGDTGSLSVPMIPIPCLVREDCSRVGGACQPDGFCVGTAAFFVDTSRGDFVFAGASPIVVTDISQPDVRLGGLGPNAADPGVRRYCGTLILDVSPDALGTFTVGFTSNPAQTFLIDDGNMTILPLSLASARITVLNDCNGNGVDDAADIASGTSDDCNGNGLPDECEPDCNSNTVADACDITAGTSSDCDGDGVPDECGFVDCNGNGVLDACDIADAVSVDINANGIPDECEAASFALVPVSATGPHSIGGAEIVIPAGGGRVTLEIRVSGWDPDQDGDPLLRAYQAQIDSTGFTSGDAGSLTVPIIPIPCAVREDCSLTGGACGPDGFCVGTAAFVADRSRADFVFAGQDSLIVTDISQPDIRVGGLSTAPGSGAADAGVSRYCATVMLDVSPDALGTFTVGFTSHPAQTFLTDNGNLVILPLNLVSARITVLNDCNGNGVDDAADIASGTSDDCNTNGVPDECEPDCNGNTVADACDISGGGSDDCNGDGVPDECQPADCNGNGTLDVCDIAAGTSPDCDGNAVPDECEFVDCNGNAVLDACDIAAGTSSDCDGNGLPDECEMADCNGNGILDACDIADTVSVDANANGVPDECELPSLALTPVSAAGLHFLTGSEIAIPAGGGPVTLEIRVADWDLDSNGDPLLRAYQAQIDSTGFTSGDTGTLSVPITPIPCTVQEDCSHVGGTCRPDGFCLGTAAFVVDTGRADFVFAGRDSLIVTDISQPDIRVAGVITAAGGGVADTGVPRYAATLTLDVSPDATGTFTVGLRLGTPPETFLVDAGNLTIEPIALASAVIRVIDDCNGNGVPDVQDVATGASPDCNANAFPDECDISFGVSGDCDGDNVPDDCQSAADCNNNGAPDFCDIATGGSLDADGNGIPDECEDPAPVALAAGDRYLEITPVPGTGPVAIRISSPDYPCLVKFAALASTNARLNNLPTFALPSDWGTVVVADPDIIPDTAYEIRADYGDALFSSAVMVRTPIWGDTVGRFVDGAWTPPNGVAEILDAVAIIDRFRNVSTAPPLSQTDLFPEVPDGVVDIADAVSAIDGFRHRPYPFSRPCP